MLLYFVPLGLVHFFVSQKNGLNTEICTKDKMKETFHMVNECLQTKQGAWEFVEDIRVIHKSLPEYVKDRCSVTPHLDDCMEIGQNHTKICLNPTQLEGLSVWQAFDKENREYVCKHQDTITNHAKTVSERCYGEGLRAALLKCGRFITDLTELFDLTNVREKCSEINKLENCAVTTLSQYCPRDVIDVYTPVLRNLKNNLCP